MEFAKYSFIQESFQLYRNWSNEELNRGCGGRYVDICSLYPTVQYYDKLPWRNRKQHRLRKRLELLRRRSRPSHRPKSRLVRSVREILTKCSVDTSQVRAGENNI